ncbi:MAG TPA: hypothetical protein VFP61_02045 [Acidimicrobiales bacterium]|nr:hypothetical protein [Acidimicrobiales bacterium]
MATAGRGGRAPLRRRARPGARPPRGRPCRHLPARRPGGAPRRPPRHPPGRRRRRAGARRRGAPESARPRRRLEIGPWYTLADELLVSGETLVRNLQLGLAAADRLGGATPVGYLPDSFGHAAQLPQLLRLAGIDHAVVWRGVPADIGATAFWWRSPDGSTVRAEHLPVGYAIGAHLPDRPVDLVRRLHTLERELVDVLGGDDPLLVLHGGDAHEPHPRLGPLLAAAAATDPTLAITRSTLLAHLRAAPVIGLPEWEGELRANARANLLAGVTSNRVDVRRAAAATEVALERRAEPLAALWLDPPSWPGASLGAAWLEVVRNAAHDSVCACSADAVVDAVLARYASARAVAAEVAADALAAAADRLPPQLTALNPTARSRRAVVEVVVAGPPPPGTQLLDRRAAGVERRCGDGGDLGRLLGALAADGWLPGGGGGRWPGPVVAADVRALAGGGTAVRLTTDAATDAAADPGVAAAMAEAWAAAGAGRHHPLEVVVERRDASLVLAEVEVAGFGWAPVLPVVSAPFPAGSPTPSPAAPPDAVAGPTWLDNGLVEVRVDAGGTWSLGRVTGMGLVVDEGDEGDTYTWSPPAGTGPDAGAVAGALAATVEVVESGPLRAALRVRTRHRWPAAVDGGRRVGAVDTTVVTDLELRRGEAFVQVVTAVDNRSRDHRLRLLLPLPRRATWSEAATAFGSVRRSGAAPAGRTEAAVATHPARPWVRAGGLTVVGAQVLDYELVAGGTALAVTVLRATGFLSRPAPSARPNQAGPVLPLAGAQVQGPQVLRWAVGTDVADPWAMADATEVPVDVVAGRGGPLPASGCRLEVAGAEVSSLQRVGGRIELRVFNPSAAPTTVAVPGRRGVLVDLRGRPVEAFEGAFPLRPWGIATALLDEPGADLPAQRPGPGGARNV